MPFQFEFLPVAPVVVRKVLAVPHKAINGYRQLEDKSLYPTHHSATISWMPGMRKHDVVDSLLKVYLLRSAHCPNARAP